MRTILSPTMLRTRYHERAAPPLKPANPKPLPPLAPPEDREAAAEAALDWLAHVQAGRIAVR